MLFISFQDNPSEEYWEQIAETRREALHEALEENEQVRMIVSTILFKF